MILDGKIVRDKKRRELVERVKSFCVKNGTVPVLVIVQVGDKEESNKYIEQKKKFGKEIGVEVRHEKMISGVTTEQVIDKIKALNTDSAVGGIIVQLPLPVNVDRARVISAVTMEKDVDGLGAESSRRLLSGEKGFVPATARGVLSLLRHYGVAVVGKNVTVIGRSILVGRPIALALLAQNATVTVCHGQTTTLTQHTKNADIVIVAIGRPKFITKEHLSPGQIIVDVGINLVGSTLVGDVDFDSAQQIVQAISPVPGGVGPLTVASLFENLLDAVEICYNAK